MKALALVKEPDLVQAGILNLLHLQKSVDIPIPGQ